MQRAGPGRNQGFPPEENHRVQARSSLLYRGTHSPRCETPESEKIQSVGEGHQLESMRGIRAVGMGLNLTLFMFAKISSNRNSFKF